MWLQSIWQIDGVGRAKIMFYLWQISCVMSGRKVSWQPAFCSTHSEPWDLLYIHVFHVCSFTTAATRSRRLCLCLHLGFDMEIMSSCSSQPTPTPNTTITSLQFYYITTILLHHYNSIASLQFYCITTILLHLVTFTVTFTVTLTVILLFCSCL